MGPNVPAINGKAVDANHHRLANIFRTFILRCSFVVMGSPGLQESLLILLGLRMLVSLLVLDVLCVVGNRFIKS